MGALEESRLTAEQGVGPTIPLHIDFVDCIVVLGVIPLARMPVFAHEEEKELRISVLF